MKLHFMYSTYNGYKSLCIYQLKSCWNFFHPRGEITMYANYVLNNQKTFREKYGEKNIE